MRHSKGVTLIELMISILIASALALMAFSLLFQQQRAWARSLAQQQLYEEGALALTVLKDDIQHAGFAVNANTVPALMQQAPLPVRYDASHSLLSLASYDIADCLGRQIDAQALEQPVINQYYVRTVEDRGPVQALFCRAFDGRAWDEVELVRGVAAFQVRAVIWQEEEAAWRYVEPSEWLGDAQVKQIEVELLLQHPSIRPGRMEGPFLYENAWGQYLEFHGDAYYERFFLLAEVLNG